MEGQMTEDLSTIPHVITQQDLLALTDTAFFAAHECIIAVLEFSLILKCGA